MAHLWRGSANTGLLSRMHGKLVKSSWCRPVSNRRSVSTEISQCVMGCRLESKGEGRKYTHPRRTLPLVTDCNPANSQWKRGGGTQGHRGEAVYHPCLFAPAAVFSTLGLFDESSSAILHLPKLSNVRASVFQSSLKKKKISVKYVLALSLESFQNLQQTLCHWSVALETTCTHNYYCRRLSLVSFQLTLCFQQCPQRYFNQL